MKPKYRILSFDEELSRYVAWNEAITIAAAMKKVQTWPKVKGRYANAAYRVVPESELRFRMQTKRDYDSFCIRIREASAFMQGRASGANSWAAFAFVEKNQPRKKPLMNATISRAAFKAVFTASKKLGKNRWLILDGQHLYATDTDVWIIIPCPSPITGRIDHRAVDVSGKGETIIVPLMDDITLDDCPMMPAHDALKTFAFDPAAFTRTLDQVAVHASTNKSRMTLNSVYMELLPGTIRLTAIDGHRLAVRELIATTSLTESAIVPLDAMLIALPAMKQAVKQELPVSVALLYDNVKSTNTKTGEASSTPTLNRVRFTAGPTTIISRVTDGPYFNIDKLNIYRAPNAIRVNRAAMLAAVENTQGLPSKGEKSTYIKLAINDVLTINGMGDALSIAIMDKRGDDAVIGLNRAYLLDALNTLVDDEITIGYGETLDKVCFYGADKAVNVVMPAKV